MRKKFHTGACRQAGNQRGCLRFLEQPWPLPPPFAHLDLERAIGLRWTLRDIKGKRLKLSPVSPADLAVLTDLGLIEMRDDGPVLTQAGHDALD